MSERSTHRCKYIYLVSTLSSELLAFMMYVRGYRGPRLLPHRVQDQEICVKGRHLKGFDIHTHSYIVKD